MMRWSDGWWYRAPDGREFLLLSVDHAGAVLRLMWSDGKHADVSESDLDGARVLGRAGAYRPAGGTR